MSEDMKTLVKYGLGEHMKGKEITYDEGRLSKSVAVKWSYYDMSKKCVIKDHQGNIVGYTQW